MLDNRTGRDLLSDVRAAIHLLQNVLVFAKYNDLDSMAGELDRAKETIGKGRARFPALLKLRHNGVCPDCDGDTRPYGHPHACLTCRGEGRLAVMLPVRYHGENETPHPYPPSCASPDCLVRVTDFGTYCYDCAKRKGDLPL